MLNAAFPTQIHAVVIGASAGGIDALREILPRLPASTPWPVLVVLHLPSKSPSLLASIFASKCELRVRDANDKEAVAPGIWFAPPDYHLLVEEGRTFALSIEPPVRHSRPSIDVLFESAARAYGQALVAIILTGANDDGTQGARAVRDRGGFLVVQDPDTATVSMMPRSAIEHANPQRILPLAEIGRTLREAALAGQS